MKTFADALREHIERTGATVTQIARGSGVNRDALYALKQGKSQNMIVDDAIRVANYFGLTVEEFMGLSPAQVRDQLVEQIARLTPQEQAILEASLTAILSQRADADQAAPQGAGTTKPPADPKGD